MHFHCPWRAGLQAQPAGETSVIVESDPSRFGVKLKGIGGADSDAGTAMSAPLLITDDILAEGLDFHPGPG